MYENPTGSPATYHESTVCSRAAEQWFALQIRSRHEKKVARELAAKKVQHYLPLYCSVRQWSDRYKSVQLPLFPGYLFVGISPEEQLLVLETRGVVRILGSSSGPSPIPEQEILNLETVVESQMPIKSHSSLLVGQQVRVIHGPLAGAEGVLQNHKRGYRLAVNVKLLGRSVTVEIASQDVVAV